MSGFSECPCWIQKFSVIVSRPRLEVFRQAGCTVGVRLQYLFFSSFCFLILRWCKRHLGLLCFLLWKVKVQYRFFWYCTTEHLLLNCLLTVHILSQNKSGTSSQLYSGTFRAFETETLLEKPKNISVQGTALPSLQSFRALFWFILPRSQTYW